MTSEQGALKLLVVSQEFSLAIVRWEWEQGSVTAERHAERLVECRSSNRPPLCRKFLAGRRVSVS